MDTMWRKVKSQRLAWPLALTTGTAPETPEGLSTMPRRTLVSIADAANILSCSQKTVRRYIASGKLDGFRMGERLIRVDANQLDSLLTPIGANYG